MDVAKYRDRLRELKRKSTHISIMNRKMVEEEDTVKHKPKVYSMSETDPHGSSAQEGTKNEKEKLMNYNMKEYEEWEQGQQKRKIRQHNGSNDLQELAKYTYEKQLRRQKDFKSSFKESDRASRIQKNSRTGKISLLDDSKLVDQLASDSKKLAMDRYLARKKEIERAHLHNTPGGYVNDKNKQFNEKLDRQLKEED